jgi:hypothetical protein
MHTANSPAIPRRSSRVQTAVPILVTSLDDTHFSEVCETLVVNAHGCAMLTRVKLAAGAPLHLHSKDGREATAHVVSCQALGQDNQNWKLGAKLDRPDNFWGLQNCPKDWSIPPSSTPASLPPSATLTSSRSFRQFSPSTSSPLGVVAPHIEVHMKKMLVESIRPLKDQIAALNQRLEQRDANPSRFEVSLSSIPPELEHQLELRLRRYLGPRLLDETRQQSSHLLEAATSAIEQKTTQGYENFLHRSEDELKIIEKRAQDISAHISASAREHLSCGLDTFQQRLLEGGNALKRLSEELLAYLQHNLKVEHDARREELEQLRTSVTAESLRLQEQIQYLDGRIAKLNDSALRLESGLEQHLGQLANQTLTDARRRLEASANETFEQIAERTARELDARLKAAHENLQTIQTGVVTYVHESLKGESVEALQSFECSMKESATQSVERWRIKIADGLNALAKSIGQQFQLETVPTEEPPSRLPK